MNYVYTTMGSPVGALKLIASNRGLAGILWEDDRIARVPHLADAVAEKGHPVLVAAEKQLAEYFAGSRTKFTLPLDFIGAEFNKKVWQALLTIPYGETRTYGQIAKEIGAPKSSRAVGAANGKNPVSIVAPCHRVIGANGKLTGFAGGLEVKAFLLKLESGKNFRLEIGDGRRR
jgi:methylated-DNA-[protein]-cysteine S-methyltransferase